MHSGLAEAIDMLKHAHADMVSHVHNVNEEQWRELKSKVPGSTFKWAIGGLFAGLLFLGGMILTVVLSLGDVKAGVSEVKTRIETQGKVEEKILDHLLDDRKK
jgi:hypothetical protein